MAEGFAKELLGPDWQIASAGIEAHGINPFAISVMSEVGIDISQQSSNILDADYLAGCTLAITLCGDAKDRCPVTPASVEKRHWPLEDPAKATGTKDERLVVFRAVRDEIREKVEALAMEFK